ncbi:hypothetical protein MTO96_009947 [Rhipicephalus appendiculatus]
MSQDSAAAAVILQRSKRHRRPISASAWTRQAGLANGDQPWLQRRYTRWDLTTRHSVKQRPGCSVPVNFGHFSGHLSPLREL